MNLRQAARKTLGAWVWLSIASCDRDVAPAGAPANASALPAHAPGGPRGCEDLGRFGGIASCCEGAYCGGHCYTDGCRCGDTFAGCFWPEICCRDRCTPHDACR